MVLIANSKSSLPLVVCIWCCSDACRWYVVAASGCCCKVGIVQFNNTTRLMCKAGGMNNQGWIKNLHVAKIIAMQTIASVQLIEPQQALYICALSKELLLHSGHHIQPSPKHRKHRQQRYLRHQWKHHSPHRQHRAHVCAGREGTYYSAMSMQTCAKTLRLPTYIVGAPPH